MASNIDKSECIKRISLLLNKYHYYQSILHPQSISTERLKSATPSQNGYLEATPNANSYGNDDGVAFVEDIDDYNDDMMGYENSTRDSQNEPDDEEEEAEEEEENEDIITYLENINVNIRSILDDYNHIIIHHYNDFESIYNEIMIECEHCDINLCPSFLRNNRCRETQNLLTFISTKNNENMEEQIKYSQDNLVIIDLLDSIHCHLLHFYDIGYAIKDNDLYLKNDEFNNNHDIPSQINYKKLAQIITEKRKLLIKTRGLDRIKNNKFQTKLKHVSNVDNKQTKEETKSIEDDEKHDGNNIQNGAKGKNNNDINTKRRVRSFSKGDIEQNVYKFGYDTSSILEMKRKYNDLKTEILNNVIFKLDIKEYTHIILKAQKKLSCDISRSLISDDYGPLLVEHIIVLILFCDYDVLRQEYSKLLRGHVLAERLSEFYNFHFGLEETIQVFGIYLSDKKSSFYLKKIRKFYHSCSKKVAFPGIKCQFNNTTSMSANITPVALYNLSENNDDGIILELGPYDMSVKYFTCSWISSFGGEDERLFINNKGSLELHNIAFIKNIVSEKQYDLRIFLQALSCFDGSLQEGWKSTSTTNEHYRIINKLIKHKEEKKEDINEYQRTIFNAFCDNKLKIEILVQNLRGPFCEILFESDPDASFNSVSTRLIRFDILCGLFRNCRVIQTWYVGNEDYNQHSGITLEWIQKLYKMLDEMNKYKKIKLNKIIINNNHQNIEPIINKQDINNKFSNKFFEKGWKIILNNFSDKMDEIIVTKIMIWNEIKVIKYNVDNGYYYIKTDIVDNEIIMIYKEFRELFEEINKKLSSEKSEIKELKKIFPSKVLFKKQNNEKLMKQRKEKLNEYFKKLIKFANDKSNKNDKNKNKNKVNIKMTIMTLLTHYLTK